MSYTSGPMPGLRQRKKDQTREKISATARRLFFERGYDAVTVAQVAEQAEVSEATVFNYFRSKEDLFFSGLDTFEADLVAAVRDRAPGDSVLAAFRSRVLSGSDRLADPGVAKGIASAGQLIAASRALQDRERAVVAQHTKALAAVIADEIGDSDHEVESAVVATALMAVHTALVELARTLAVRGVTGEALAKAVQTQGAVAFDRLAAGLLDYRVKSRSA